MAFKPSSALIGALAGVPLLSECSKKEVQALAREGKVFYKKAGSTIIAEGMKGIAFFLVLDGTVDISRGRTTSCPADGGETSLASLLFFQTGPGTLRR